MKHTHWGIETWLLGSSKYRATLGDGRDVVLKQLVAIVSGSAQSQAKTEPPFEMMREQRQSLLILGTDPMPPIEATTEQDQATNCEVDSHLLMVNVKTMGEEVVHIPVTMAFPEPVPIPNGKLFVQIDTVGPGPSTKSTDALNTEAHFTFFWDYV